MRRGNNSLASIAVAALAWLLVTSPALACELSPGGSEPPVLTRRPAQGDEVRLTSGFGMRFHPLLNVRRMHPGVDWAAPRGTPVIAAGPGQVVFAGEKGEYSNAIAIDHGGGWQTFYSQLSSIEVGVGDCVAFGALIGKVGSTGLSSGPHLHFEVRQNGQPIDPLSVGVSNEPREPEEHK
jgi:murein DD-endopeptidase MepM/ murein hydrolase activator NlpD